jgi:hypothetical protein
MGLGMPRLAITGRNFWLLFGGIWVLVGAPFLVIGLYIGAQNIIVNKRLDTEGRSVEGMVLTKEIRSSSSSHGRRSSGPTYHVTFRFVTPSGLITGDAEVNVNVWENLVEREPIQVTYLPDDPQYYRIEGQSSGWVLPIIFSVLGGVFTFVGGFLFFRSLGQLRTKARLQREGITTTATVSDVQASYMRINGVNQCVVLYHYQDDRGRSHTGKEYFSPEEAGRWKQGDRVTIRYDRRRPQHSIWIGTS